MIKRFNIQTKYLPQMVIIGLLVILLGLRLWLMAVLPLTDTTEARYGELARVTAEGNFWLMPHMTPDNPFFAKPPLSTWLSSISWLYLGKNEFALRLPSFFLSILTCFAFFYMAKSLQMAKRNMWLASLIFMSCPIGFISSGAVMTDATQLAIVTWAMAFALNIFMASQTNSDDSAAIRKDLLGFWIMMGLASYAKGLASIILISLPIVVFVMLLNDRKKILQFAKMILSFWHMCLMLVIILAWYIPAEMAYPGFLKYFIIGEHFQRFMEPHWQGDRYGTAHHEILGKIWVFWAASIGIWLPIFLYMSFKKLITIKHASQMVNRWLWVYLLTPLIFFTFASNIIGTYTLTALPAFAMLTERYWADIKTLAQKLMLGLLCIWTVVCVFGAALYVPAMADQKSAQPIIAFLAQHYPQKSGYIIGRQAFSASYYAHMYQIHATTLESLNKLSSTEKNTLLTQSDIFMLLRENDAALLETQQYGKIVFSHAGTALLITNKRNNEESSK